jgi:hypothetical protein
MKWVKNKFQKKNNTPKLKKNLVMKQWVIKFSSRFTKLYKMYVIKTNYDIWNSNSISS